LPHASLVCVYSPDLAPHEITGPLAQFQCTKADREGTLRLLRALNGAYSGPKLKEGLLQQVFDLWWPRLEARLDQIEDACASSIPPTLSLEDKVDEILEILRHISSSVGGAPPEETIRPGRLRPVTSQSSTATRPKVFIGSSTEGLEIARAIQFNLESNAETTVWDQSVFAPSLTLIENIVNIAAAQDFAVLVLTADDLVTSRGSTNLVPRDNIFFELGLFTGQLGRARTFLVYSKDDNLHLPTDLMGVTAVTYRRRTDGNLAAALGPACTVIRRAMGVVGVSPDGSGGTPETLSSSLPL